MDIYQSLKNEILNGTIPLGTRLPEASLAKRFKSSRTPIREALRKLEADDLIVILPNKGAQVRKYTPKNIKDNFDIRAHLEGYAAMLASANRNDIQLKSLLESVEKSECGLEVYKSRNVDEGILMIVEANNIFHSTILDMSGNEELSKVSASLVTLPITFRGFYWYNIDRLTNSILQHRLIFEAIKNQDAISAEAYMKAHLLNGRDNVLENIQKDKNK